MKVLNSKRFFVRKSLIGKNQIIKVEFKNGKTAQYNHDDAFKVMKEKLEKMNCWEKYKSYTSSSSIPVVVRPSLIPEQCLGSQRDGVRSPLSFPLTNIYTPFKHTLK